MVAEVVGFEGLIRWDTSRPNGTPRKLLDVSKATSFGWTYKTELEEGIRLSYKDFLNNPMRLNDNITKYPLNGDYSDREYTSSHSEQRSEDCLRRWYCNLRKSR